MKNKTIQKKETKKIEKKKIENRTDYELIKLTCNIFNEDFETSEIIYDAYCFVCGD